MVKNQRNSCCHMGCPPMIGDLHFHRGYSLRLQESKPLKNNGIISQECALEKGLAPSNSDTVGGPPQPPSVSPLETLRVTAPLSDEPFPAWYYPHTDPLTSPLQPSTDDAPRTPTTSRPAGRSITTESVQWHGRLAAHTSAARTAGDP